MARRVRSGGESLAGTGILLGVSGSVAAYKAAELARLLVKAGARVRVAMTPGAREFVASLTFQAITGAPPVTDMFSGTGSPDAMDHIAAVRAADLYVIAPASATTLARLAAGSAEEPVSALACAATCPVLLAPAMNREMWANPAVQRNVASLRGDGRLFVEPGAGELACGEHGLGRLGEPEEIVAVVAGIAGSSAGRDRRAGALSGRRVVVSAGATEEAIDDMRVLTNRSSGRMGAAVAAAARDAGAEVHLLAGRMEVEPPPGIAAVVPVGDTASLARAARRACRGAACYIGIAAVADYRMAEARPGKLERSAGGIELSLEATEDVIAGLARSKGAPRCIAFAAEAGGMRDAVASARRKLRAKGVAAVVACPLEANLGGEDCDVAYVTARSAVEFGRMSKAKAAARIVERIAAGLRR